VQSDLGAPFEEMICAERSDLIADLTNRKDVA
jgi:hypothetical protein